MICDLCKTVSAEGNWKFGLKDLAISSGKTGISTKYPLEGKDYFHASNCDTHNAYHQVTKFLCAFYKPKQCRPWPRGHQRWRRRGKGRNRMVRYMSTLSWSTELTLTLVFSCWCKRDPWRWHEHQRRKLSNLRSSKRQGEEAWHFQSLSPWCFQNFCIYSFTMISFYFPIQRERSDININILTKHSFHII